eukprot:scaffold9137_cov275-Amphora_coffeaeformis.AAC.1
MKGRVGDEARPSWALLDRHVRSFEVFFEEQYLKAGTLVARMYWARAGLANLFLWLGWLRARELFDLRWIDVQCTPPNKGDRYDLPPNVGCILLRLSEQTKTNRSR